MKDAPIKQEGNTMKIAVVIPCYRETNNILGVINAIPKCVDKIYVVDDACPDGTGEFVRRHTNDSRVRVLINKYNLGVGGAAKEGYKLGLREGFDIFVKIDGDGQMDPLLIHSLVANLINGSADYVKGNRFFNLQGLQSMPWVRIFGNAILSIFNKFSSGYWDIFDPTNGYTAIRKEALVYLPLDKISNSYFFESDMLFRLGLQKAVVHDFPMDAVYADEKSSMNIAKILPEFLYKHSLNTSKRIIINYFIRDLSIASLQLLFGICFLVFGLCYGISNWIEASASDSLTPAGVVMLAALTFLTGFHLIMGFLAFDIANVPSRVIDRQYPIARE